MMTRGDAKAFRRTELHKRRSIMTHVMQKGFDGLNYTDDPSQFTKETQNDDMK